MYKIGPWCAEPENPIHAGLSWTEGLLSLGDTKADENTRLVRLIMWSLMTRGRTLNGAMNPAKSWRLVYPPFLTVSLHADP
jgi:hypothetical protein